MPIRPRFPALRIGFLALLLAGPGAVAVAQTTENQTAANQTAANQSAERSPAPERRVVVERDLDFYGGDMDELRDVSQQDCVAACLGRAECAALTYNPKARACFLKTGVDEIRPYAGAVSARIVATPAPALRRAETRAKDLDFLPGGYLAAAREDAATLGARALAGGLSLEQLQELGRTALRSGALAAARDAFGALAARRDAARDWAALADARAALAAERRAAKRRRAARRMTKAATLATINAYLRAPAAPARAATLSRLAALLERRGQGRAAIPALRLAQRLAPTEARAQALARMVSLHGFRVVGDSVDSDAASPRICVEFSEPLARGVDFAPYARAAGADLPVEAKDRQLCLDGARHGTRYRVTLRAGLPAASGEVLDRSVDLQLYVRDRKPALRFPGRAYVLAKGGGAALPIATVNLSEVDLRIHRVGARNLRAAMREGLFGRALNAWEETRIDDELGAPVWTGTAEVEVRLNAETVTALPLGEAIADFAPGAYAMTARAPDGGADEGWRSAATQWFVVTDLGLATLAGDDGLHVFARSLASAQGVAGARLQLIAVNNAVLGAAVADARGYARFAPGLMRGTGGAAPALLIVEPPEGATEDFAFLDLTEAGFDLSDRGVEGRPPAGPIDLFAATERGVYRPGETVHATILARDASGDATRGLPLTVVIRRPDGVEHSRMTAADAGAGGRALSFRLDPGAQRGAWRMAVHADPGAPALAVMSFLVEDFLPERLDAELSAPEGVLAPDALPPLELAARHLYGAPAAGLHVEGEIAVSASRELPGFPGYRFGLENERVDARARPLPEGLVTDDAGLLRIPFALPGIAPTTRPLNVTATIRALDGGGRPVERRLTRPLAPAAPLIGIRPLFDGAADEGGQARFEIAAVGRDLARMDLGEASWTLERLHTTYQWYELDGNWRYEPVITRKRLASGAVELRADAPARIEAPVDWGRYELKLTRIAGGAYAAASLTFSAGWHGAGAGSDTPDLLRVGLDRAAYRVGDTARLRLNPRDAGMALVAVADNRLIDMRVVEITAADVAAGEKTVALPVTEAWGPGAYVIASLIRPMDVARKRNPTRALGLGWAKVDPGARLLAGEFETPARAAPRAPLDAVLRIDGLAPGETAYATIAAVDAGILNLTGYKAPAPEDWYFGQRRLGVRIRDMYGRLIDGMQGAAGRLRSGGDGGGAARIDAPPPTQDLAAFFSGVVTADAAGRVSARFDMPDFNGTVRLMAVIWSARGVGHAQKDVLVRDPVVATISAPRFLAPGDRSRALIELTHVEGPAGATKVTLAGEGLSIAPDRAAMAVDLARGKTARLLVPIEAGMAGEAALRLTVVTPGGEALEKTLRIPVRANDPPIARRSRLTIAAGGKALIDAEVFDGVLPGTGRVTLSAGPLARLDAPGLLAALDRYPYGCTEQLTSRALPLIYFDRVAAALGVDAPPGRVRDAPAQRVDAAIRGTLANQAASGGFGLWRARDGDGWLDAYVSDFLSRARTAGRAVPARAFEAALDNLANHVAWEGDFEEGGEALAYALMVLAREGRASIGDLRYYADAKGEDFATPLARAQLGAALAMYGEPSRADAMFRLALAALDEDGNGNGNGWRADYGSARRDRAGVLALAVEAGSNAVGVAALTESLARAGDGRASTQEMAWTLLAANALLDDARGGLAINGVALDGPLARSVDAAALAAGPLEIANLADAPTEAALTVFGVPETPPKAGGDGYRIERRLFTLAGEPASQQAVTLGDRLVVVLDVASAMLREARLMIDDPLPAGFEIDNPNLLRGGDVAALDWLDPLDDPRHVEFRADRFLAAVDWSGIGRFRLAYVVRAVSPGIFRYPAASVEDMYRPEARAWGDFGRLTVLGAMR